MSHEQTAAQRAFLETKAANRAVLRAEYLKEASNPFRHGEGGTLVRAKRGHDCYCYADWGYFVMDTN